MPEIMISWIVEISYGQAVNLTIIIMIMKLIIVIFVMVNSILTSPICTVQTIVQTERKGQIGIELIITLIEVIFLIIWGARGRWFESSHPDIKKVLQVFVEPFLFIFNTYFNTSSSKVVSERGEIIKSAIWYTRQMSPRFFVATLLWMTSGSKNFQG